MPKKIVQYTEEELDDFREIFKENWESEEKIEYDIQCLIDERQAFVDAQELKKWERSVEPWYISNFLPYKNWLSNKESNELWSSFWNLDNDILIKACQNDIRMLLKNFWKGFSWEIKIKYKWWRPESMVASIEYIDNKDKNTAYDKLKDFIAWYGFVAYRKFWDYLTRIIWEKLYRYSTSRRTARTGEDLRIDEDGSVITETEYWDKKTW